MRKLEELTNPKACMFRAAEREMTFVLLGRDVAAPATIRFWVRERIRLGRNKSNDRQLIEALDCATIMEREREQPEVPSDPEVARSTVTVSLGEFLFEFGSEVEWSNKGQAWYASVKGRLASNRRETDRGTIAIDARGRVCEFGRHFMRATAEKAYPIKVYATHAAEG